MPWRLIAPESESFMLHRAVAAIAACAVSLLPLTGLASPTATANVWLGWLNAPSAFAFLAQCVVNPSPVSKIVLARGNASFVSDGSAKGTATLPVTLKSTNVIPGTIGGVVRCTGMPSVVGLHGRPFPPGVIDAVSPQLKAVTLTTEPVTTFNIVVVFSNTNKPPASAPKSKPPLR